MTEDEIRAALGEAGLEHATEDIMRMIRPAIRIADSVTNDEMLPIGRSKFGGAPDLPAGLQWPEWRETPLGFLAQFNLAEIAPYDTERVLPQSGLLSFFYEASEQPWGYELSDRGAWRVFSSDCPTNELARRAPPSLPGRSQLAAHTLTFETALTLPYDSADSLQLGLSGDEYDRFLEVAHRTIELTHQLLGYPNAVQGAMEGECERCTAGLTAEQAAPLRIGSNDFEIGAAKRWRLLLQLDSITNIRGWTTDWGMSGLLYFWIRTADLTQHDFSNVWLQLQTT